MTHYTLRSQAADGVLIGTFIGYNSPSVVEAVGGAGFGFLCLDAEHTPLTVGDIENLIRAADLAGSPTIVRVPETGSYISRVLDAGAAGILVPRIESAEDAQDAVGRARYAPDGYRGLGPGRGGFIGGDIPTHTRRVNDEILVTIQIETAAGLAAADEIVSVPGIDAVIVGPADLAASLGVPIGSPAHIGAIDQIFAAANEHGVAAGAFCFSAADARSSVERGARVIILGADAMFLTAGAHQMWDSVANLTGVVAGVAK
jgi:2-keto-3-deoxy-L-rhamnonate aldolase RhmA